MTHSTTTALTLDVSGLPYSIEPMRLADIDEIMTIERIAFAGAPWTVSAYRHELTQNDTAHYSLLRARPPAVSLPPAPRSRWRSLLPGRRVSLPMPAPLAPILSYGGFWYDDAQMHISTIAVTPAWRGRHLGELLLAALLAQGFALGARHATLEVRMTNTIAQNLYRKYGFSVESRRKRYYTDNGEDALLMATTRLDQTEFQSAFAQHTQQLRLRLLDQSVSQPALRKV